MKREHWGFVARRACQTFADALLSPAVVLPVLILRLGGGAMMVGLLTSMIALAGPSQLLSAWYLEGTRCRLRPLFRTTLAGTLPPLLLAGALIAWAPARPHWALAAVVGAFFLRNVIGALGNPAELDLSRQLIREEERARVFSIRGVASNTLGLIASGVTLCVLGAFSFPHGYTALALLAFAACLAGWGSLFLLREAGAEAAEAAELRRERPGDFIRGSLAMLVPGRGGRELGRFRKFVLLRQTIMLSRCAFPFLAVYAFARFELDEKMAGAFLIALTAGQIGAGALLSALAGRLRDARRIMQLALLCLAAGLLAALLTPRWEGLLCSFFLQGSFLAGMMAAGPMLMMEYAPPGKAVRGMVLSMVACHPLGIVTPIAAGALMAGLGFPVLATVAIVLAFAALAGLSLPPFTERRTERFGEARLPGAD